MKSKEKSFLLLLVLSALATAVVVLAAPDHYQNSSANDQRNAILKRIHAEDYPIADYQSSESTDPKEREKRRIRNNRHDLSADIKPEDIKRFTLRDSDPEILIPLAASHATAEPGIPIELSDVVTIAEVISAEAFLSNDKTSVYSEFILRMESVLKNCNSEPLSAGAEIAAERLGGRIRFPSGKLLLRGAPYGRNMPRVGRRYVFFLKNNDDGHDFTIITAFELRSGSVFPLDGSPEGDLKSPQFAKYEEFAGMYEVTFLDRVRRMIKNVK